MFSSLTSGRTTMEQSGGGHVESVIRKAWDHWLRWDPSLPFSLVFDDRFHRYHWAGYLHKWNLVIDCVCGARSVLWVLSEWCSIYSCLKSRTQCVFQRASMLPVCCYGQHQPDNWNSALAAWRTERHQICKDVWPKVKIPGVDRNLQPLW